MAITTTKATPAQRTWLERYEKETRFEPLHQEELDSGEMSFAEVVEANLDWFQDWSSDTFLVISKTLE